MTAPESIIVLLATLDTKSDEAGFLRDCIRVAGFDVTLIDVGVHPGPTIAPDVPRQRVAESGGSSIESLLRENNRGLAIDVMLRGAGNLVAEVCELNELAGVISLGGSGGTAIGCAAMRRLPLGVPKVMISTLASGDTQPYVGEKDICMIHSVVDFCGLNPVIEPILRNAAGAICGMVQARRAAAASTEPTGKGAPLVAASMFGVTTPCVNKSRALLEAVGLRLVPFHATGIGGRAMESLIEEGFFAAVLDITTTEWADEVVGGTLSAGPKRLAAGAKSGLAQVIVPGALDMVNFVGPAGLPEKFHGRTVFRHNENVTLMRTTAAECREIGRRMAERLNEARGPTTVVFPLRGLSALDAAGSPFFDPDADRALLDALSEHCRPPIHVMPVDCHINDDEFAERCCRELLVNLSKQESGVSKSGESD